jgi:hypothetical protein
VQVVPGGGADANAQGPATATLVERQTHGDMMANKQTDLALAKRAVQAANVMETWTASILKEMKKQGAMPYPFGGPVILSAEMLHTMCEKMLAMIGEIRDFEKKDPSRYGKK